MKNNDILEKFFLKNDACFISAISKYYPLQEDLLDKYKNKWDWSSLSRNTNITWTKSLLNKYIGYFYWELLSLNQSLPWSEDLIREFESEWYLNKVSEIVKDDKLLVLIDQLKEKRKDLYSLKCTDINSFSKLLEELKQRDWEYDYNLEMDGTNELVYWSEDFIDKFEYELKNEIGENLVWAELSQNTHLPWSEALLEKYKNKWKWSILSSNNSLPWNISLIDKFKDKWDWREMSLNKGLPWSEDFIDKYLTSWDWDVLSRNHVLPWSTYFVNKYIKYWSFFGLSRIKSSFWTEKFIENYGPWNWESLSWNNSLPWSEDFIDKYIRKWNWMGMSNNEGLPFDESFINKYSVFWEWENLGKNKNAVLTNGIIESSKKNKYIDISGFYENKYIKWDLELFLNYIKASKHNVYKIEENLWNILQPFINEEFIEKILHKSKRSFTRGFEELPW